MRKTNNRWIQVNRSKWSPNLTNSIEKKNKRCYLFTVQLQNLRCKKLPSSFSLRKHRYHSIIRITIAWNSWNESISFFFRRFNPNNDFIYSFDDPCCSYSVMLVILRIYNCIRTSQWFEKLIIFTRCSNHDALYYLFFFST
jgi:hypothetical protein